MASATAVASSANGAEFSDPEDDAQQLPNVSSSEGEEEQHMQQEDYENENDSGTAASLFVPSASPASFGASAPVVAALSGFGNDGAGAPSSATAGAALASLSGAGSDRSASLQSKKKKKANVQYKDHCDNCLTDQTAQWRKGRRGETFCQDCGRSERRHDYNRLKQQREKAIERTLVDVLHNSVYIPKWGSGQQTSNKGERNASADEAEATAAIMTMSASNDKQEPNSADENGSDVSEDNASNQAMEEDPYSTSEPSSAENKRPSEGVEDPENGNDDHTQSRPVSKRKADASGHDDDDRTTEHGEEWTGASDDEQAEAPKRPRLSEPDQSEEPAEEANEQ